MDRYKYLALLCSIGLLAGCDKSAKDSSENDNAVTQTDEGGMTRSGDPLEAVMKGYETCRELLAKDSSDGVSACAKAMHTAASAGKAGAPDAAKPHLAAIATAAQSLAAAPKDIEAQRAAYGEVSKNVVALLTAVPELAKDYHVFECPMAKGYKRWAQPGSELANPYMGKKMLECGTEVHDHHQGMHGGDPDPKAAALAAYEAAKPVFEEHCGHCHTSVDDPSEKRKKALEHFVMDSYPFGGHHAAEIGAEVREVLGVDGDEATMPKDDPGAVKGAELEKLVAWSKAFDAARGDGADHHGGDHGDNGDKHGHDGHRGH